MLVTRCRNVTQIHGQCKVTVIFRVSSESFVPTPLPVWNQVSPRQPHTLAASPVASSYWDWTGSPVTSSFCSASLRLCQTINYYYYIQHFSNCQCHSLLDFLSSNISISIMRSIHVLQSHSYITATFSSCFLMYLFLLGLKYVAYYTPKFSHQQAWLYKAKLFHEPNRQGTNLPVISISLQLSAAVRQCKVLKLVKYLKISGTARLLLPRVNIPNGHLNQKLWT